MKHTDELSRDAMTFIQRFNTILRYPDIRVTILWLALLALMIIWNSLNLNQPAARQIEAAAAHSFGAAAFVTVLSLGAGWAAGVSLYFLEKKKNLRWLLSAVNSVMNLLRSVPNLIILFIGYAAITYFIRHGAALSSWTILLWMSGVTAVCLFQEAAQTIRERIRTYERSDFIDAMLCCGIPEWVIIHKEILLKNSAAHLLHKAITVFGSAIFLQCSIDFVISVGLSTDVSLSNFPITLGNLLAKMDSKQDILAIGTLFSNPGYLPQLFVKNLQGLTVAGIIIGTLIAIHKISAEFVRRKRLE